MEMRRLEKRLVNRRKKAERNIAKVRQCLSTIKLKNMRDALELGCGIGAVAAYLAATYEMDAYGIDYDSEQIKIARRMHPETARLQYRVEDAAHLSFQDASFDLIVSQNVFHHIRDWQAVVKEIARVLKPEGFLIWLDLAFPKFIQTLFQPLAKKHSLYCFSDVRGAFETHGFKQIFYERLMHGFFFHHHVIWQKK
jgi:ubiquinone/menaquinone biosynthesis C-methylase UbiE